MDLARWLQSKR